jgi:hypothetical protein
MTRGGKRLPERIVHLSQPSPFEPGTRITIARTAPGASGSQSLNSALS